MNTKPIRNLARSEFVRPNLVKSARALAIGVALAFGSAQALTTTTVIDLGTAGNGTTVNAGTPVLKIGLGTLPAGSLLRSVALSYRLDGGNPYLGDLAPLFADSNGNNGVLMIAGTPNDGGYPKSAAQTVSWNSGDDYSVGVTGSVTLTAVDGIPAIDLSNYAVWLQTGWNGTWSGSITLEYDVPDLQVRLDTPADGEGFPTGSSIDATATVIEPTPATGPYTVKFYTKLLPAGSLVEWTPSNVGVVYTAAFGVLDPGDYEVYATVEDSATPTPGTATSATRTFHVASTASTTATVVSSVTPSTYGQNVTFTATVSPIPTGGTVQFYDGVEYLGDPVAVNTGTGQATYSSATLGAGVHEISAEFSGHWLFAASTSASAFTQTVDKAPLTVKALNTLRAPDTANPDPFPYQITGYQNGEDLATSGVTGSPELTTNAILSSPPGDYQITCAVGTLAADNYDFSFANGTLTVVDVANTFSVNFYSYGGLTTPEQEANVLVPAVVPAGLPGGWYTSGWSNFEVPWHPGSPLAPVTLTSNKGSTATFTFKDCRNGWTYSGGPRTTLLGDGNGNMMDGHVNSTFDPGDGSNLFDMEVTEIPFAKYDVIFYMGANAAQFGEGNGRIVFNGVERGFKVIAGAFDGTFTEMTSDTTPGNYIVFSGLTGTSFTTKTWGTDTVGGQVGFNHVGPFGFQIREVAGYGSWASVNADNQTPDLDYDNDGVENGVEYFMGQTGSSFTAMPSLDATNTIAWTMDTSYQGTYEVQTSPDLDTWTNVDPKPLPSGGTLSYTLPTGLGKRFVRLLVTPAP